MTFYTVEYLCKSSTNPDITRGLDRLTLIEALRDAVAVGFNSMKLTGKDRVLRYQCSILSRDQHTRDDKGVMIGTVHVQFDTHKGSLKHWTSPSLRTARADYEIMQAYQKGFESGTEYQLAIKGVNYDRA